MKLGLAYSNRVLMGGTGLFLALRVQIPEGPLGHREIDIWGACTKKLTYGALAMDGIFTWFMAPAS